MKHLRRFFPINKFTKLVNLHKFTSFADLGQQNQKKHENRFFCHLHVLNQ